MHVFGRAWYSGSRINFVGSNRLPSTVSTGALSQFLSTSAYTVRKSSPNFRSPLSRFVSDGGRYSKNRLASDHPDPGYTSFSRGEWDLFHQHLHATKGAQFMRLAGWSDLEAEVTENHHAPSALPVESDALPFVQCANVADVIASLLVSAPALHQRWWAAADWQAA